MYDIFGDGETMRLRWTRIRKPWRRSEASSCRMYVSCHDDVSIRTVLTFKYVQVFEPSDLTERMMTQKDEQIRSSDIPERIIIQLETQTDRDVKWSDESISSSLPWIIDNLRLCREKYGLLDTGFPFDTTPGSIMSACVESVLKFFNHDRLEVPYIFANRRDVIWKLRSDQNAMAKRTSMPGNFRPMGIRSWVPC